MENVRKKIIVIAGPTASGKTGIGVKLAKEFDGEIISADSRQIYRGLDLGTGKEGEPCGETSKSQDPRTNQIPNLNKPIGKLEVGKLNGSCALDVENLREKLRCIDGINQWLIDIVNPGEEFSLFDWISAAKLAMDDIWSRGKLPIVVGGTGLYIQALVEGFSLQQISNFQFPISHSSLSLRALPSESKTNQIPIRQMADKNQKKSVIAAPDQVEGKTPAGIQVAQSKQLPGSPGTTLKNTAGPEDDTILLKEKYSRGQLNSLTIEQLNNILKDLDPVAFETVDKRNSRRLIRAIELAQEGLRPVKIKPDFEVLQIAIDLPRRELHERIDRRVDERFEQGMLREVIGLLKRGVDPEWLVGLGLEYREITEYLTSKNQEPRTNQILNYKYQLEAENWNLNGGCNLGVLNYEYGLMVQKLKFRIHQYARRQITWFKRFPEINWLSDYNEIKRFMKIFLEH